MHKSQRLPKEVANEARAWMDQIHPLVLGPHFGLRYMINMDQTPVFFDECKKTTRVDWMPNNSGSKTTSDTKRATVAISITLSGHTLTPAIVFKGTENGRIKEQEFSIWPTNMLYQMQKNAWMDKRVMVFWVVKVLKPYVESALEHVIPIIFLLSYRCHIMGLVVNAIQSMGCKVQHIPGRCTCLCQPVDVGYNKPFKSQACTSWVRWMILDGILHGTTSPRLHA